MQDEPETTEQTTTPDQHIKEVMGPTAEESKPVSVPNESAVPAVETGEVVQPETPVDDSSERVPDDQEVEKAFKNNAIGWQEKFKHHWRHYWRRPYAKLYTFGGLGVVVTALLWIPGSRYFLLNNIGVRSSTSISLYDETTKQPLKNVQVSARGITSVTGADGKAKLEHVKMGRTKMVIKRRAFADIEKTLTLGWGSNPLGNLELHPIGAQYTFFLRDWLSNQPVEGAEARSGDLSGFSDRNGKLVLTVDASQNQDISVDVVAKSYRTEKVSLGSTSKDITQLQLVPGRKQPFVSKQAGKFDLYSIDADGKNETMVLKATGTEQEQMGLISHPTDEVAAFISTREDVRNSEGFLLSTLTLVDLSNNSTHKVAQSERLQVIGWVGTRLIFAQISAGASAANAARQKLLAYDYKTQKTVELAKSNSFNDLLLIGKDIYYAPSNIYTPKVPSGLFKITAEATNKQTVFDKEVWNIFRNDYTSIDLSVQQEWYKFDLNSGARPVKQSGPPSSQKNRIYTDSPDGKHSLWVDERDGKGALLLYDVAAKSEKVIASQAGLNLPVRWLDDHTVVYRIHTPQESADYVLNTAGGSARKIRDITHTDGQNRWYYY